MCNYRTSSVLALLFVRTRVCTILFTRNITRYDPAITQLLYCYRIRDVSCVYVHCETHEKYRKVVFLPAAFQRRHRRFRRRCRGRVFFYAGLRHNGRSHTERCYYGGRAISSLRSVINVYTYSELHPKTFLQV